MTDGEQHEEFVNVHDYHSEQSSNAQIASEIQTQFLTLRQKCRVLAEAALACQIESLMDQHQKARKVTVESCQSLINPSRWAVLMCLAGAGFSLLVRQRICSGLWSISAFSLGAMGSSYLFGSYYINWLCRDFSESLSTLHETSLVFDGIAQKGITSIREFELVSLGYRL